MAIRTHALKVLFHICQNGCLRQSLLDEEWVKWNETSLPVLILLFFKNMVPGTNQPILAEV